MNAESHDEFENTQYNIDNKMYLVADYEKSYSKEHVHTFTTRDYSFGLKSRKCNSILFQQDPCSGVQIPIDSDLIIYNHYYQQYYNAYQGVFLLNWPNEYTVCKAVSDSKNIPVTVLCIKTPLHHIIFEPPQFQGETISR